MSKNKVLEFQGHKITITKINEEDYFSLTEMAKNFGGNDQIKNWIRTRQTIEFLGTWEAINNPDFNMVGLHHVRLDTMSERFIISPTQWIERTKLYCKGMERSQSIFSIN
ncbi:MAG: KilA-N domain-containing protein [Candidatus Pedobacter colombiensis]|uniref:KilA-N domain-containing protein n=1 Tax=Candidatus Pedobacter colombiensis TaxID=3121371 RepID=A0AAJ6B6F5_9SPHI|nr:KilA-N domain-containing protein [Pedobacter sp.]WEK18376.1 MAG: KilA-N domain-containing protein [Pedobacter sp.]